VELLQQQTNVKAELDVPRESKAMEESELSKLKNKNKDILRHLLKTVPDQGIKNELKLRIDRLAEEIKEMNDKISIKQKELTTLETNRKYEKRRRKFESEKKYGKLLRFEAILRFYHHLYKN
jgi:dynactin complex subunit